MMKYSLSDWETQLHCITFSTNLSYSWFDNDNYVMNDHASPHCLAECEYIEWIVCISQKKSSALHLHSILPLVCDVMGCVVVVI